MSGNLYCVYDGLNAIGRERLDNDSVILCVFLREFFRNLSGAPKKLLCRAYKASESRHHLHLPIIAQ